MKENIEITNQTTEDRFNLVIQKTRTDVRTFPSPEEAKNKIEEELDRYYSGTIAGDALAILFAAMSGFAVAAGKDREAAEIALLCAGLSSTALIFSHDKPRKELLQQQLDYLNNFLGKKK